MSYQTPIEDCGCHWCSRIATTPCKAIQANQDAVTALTARVAALEAQTKSLLSIKLGGGNAQ